MKHGDGNGFGNQEISTRKRKHQIIRMNLCLIYGDIRG